MSPAPAIEARDLTRKFGSRIAVDRVSFAVEPGTSVAVFGANGAGKTTLLRILSSALKATSGDVRIAGLDYRKAPAEIRRRIGVISHSSYLYGDLPVRENLVFYAKLYGVSAPHDAADRMLETMELSARADDPAKVLSRGMTQRLSVARSLVHDPDVVFLDEPFSGLDPHAAVVLRNTLDELRRQRRTLLMVTHDIPLGLRMSDRHLVMARGKLVADGASPGVDPVAFARTHFGDARHDAKAKAAP